MASNPDPEQHGDTPDEELFFDLIPDDELTEAEQQNLPLAAPIELPPPLPQDQPILIPIPPPAKRRPSRLKKLGAALLLTTGLTTVGALGTSYYCHNTLERNYDISGVPYGEDGTVSCGIPQFFKRIFSKNDNMVVGDTDHTAEEIPLFIAANAKTMKEAGVDAVFIEYSRDFQDAREALLNQKLCGHDCESEYYLLKQCEKHGIRVVLMDVPENIKTPAANEANRKDWEFFIKRKRDSSYKRADNETPTTEERTAHNKGRDEATDSWAELIEAKKQHEGWKKVVVIGGSGHTAGSLRSRNASIWGKLFPRGDLTALLKGNTVYTEIEVKPGADQFRIRFNQRRMLFPGKGPEYTIQAPELRKEIKKGLNLPDFAAITEEPGLYEILPSVSDEYLKLKARPVNPKRHSFSLPEFLQMKKAEHSDYLSHEEHLSYAQYCTIRQEDPEGTYLRNYVEAIPYHVYQFYKQQNKAGVLDDVGPQQCGNIYASLKQIGFILESDIALPAQLNQKIAEYMAGRSRLGAEAREAMPVLEKIDVQQLRLVATQLDDLPKAKATLDAFLNNVRKIRERIPDSRIASPDNAQDTFGGEIKKCYRLMSANSLMKNPVDSKWRKLAACAALSSPRYSRYADALEPQCTFFTRKNHDLSEPQKAIVRDAAGKWERGIDELYDAALARDAIKVQRVVEELKRLERKVVSDVPGYDMLFRVADPEKPPGEYPEFIGAAATLRQLQQILQPAVQPALPAEGGRGR